jgi:hypothetical protein
MDMTYTGRRGKTHLHRFVLGKSWQIGRVSKITKLKEARPMEVDDSSSYYYGTF